MLPDKFSTLKKYQVSDTQQASRLLRNSITIAEDGLQQIPVERGIIGLYYSRDRNFITFLPFIEGNVQMPEKSPIFSISPNTLYGLLAETNLPVSAVFCSEGYHFPGGLDQSAFRKGELYCPYQLPGTDKTIFIL
jgi:hypothetical protein